MATNKAISSNVLRPTFTRGAVPRKGQAVAKPAKYDYGPMDGLAKLIGAPPDGSDDALLRQWITEAKVLLLRIETLLTICRNPDHKGPHPFD